MAGPNSLPGWDPGGDPAPPRSVVLTNGTLGGIRQKGALGHCSSVSLAWIAGEEALQHLCSTAQKKNWAVTQGGVWISLECLQPFAIQDGSTQKEEQKNCDIHPCLLLCCSCLQQGTPPELPTPLSESPVPMEDLAGQSGHPGLAAPAPSPGHISSTQWWKVAAEGTYTLTCHYRICQRTPVSLPWETEAWQHSHSPHQTQKQADAHYRGISHQQRWATADAYQCIAIWTQTGPL